MSSDFYRNVYRVVAEIPEGKVTTYGAIATCLGVASGARMVGYALNQLIHEKSDEPLPAHRVVNRLGQLTGRAWFPGDTMRERLEQEGVRFTEEYTVDIDKHFWDPGLNI
ncbi:MGMT family protein [Rhodohalobacter mucosus]|uniref:6-O-methylguanine DNA methyltransferase n=1 Tax=Rhodohalobacter mucosus TaxID=2079485 RepID=A0A316TVC7_9BACT|nr:MGMT family protein [Rhodohalobacter mucosus]PWN07055.1 6-O-methylguanine DNA methyltransferase [Rhodohalobacter mucosus]